MKHKVTNLGATVRHPFCMAYIFTPKGTKRLSGSLDRISEATSAWGICHGMVHFYQNMGMSKEWMLFGGGHTRMRDGFRLEHIKSGKDDWVPHWYPMKPKRATWAIYDVFGRKVIGTWRKLPSHFLRQLEKYQDGHPRTPLKGGL